ncbi:MAG: hypothetical protein ACP5RD_05405 [bacterium]
MDLKIEIVSSAFDNNIYPKGVACFKANLSYNNINIELYYTVVANSLNIYDLVQADNHCQNLIIKKAINTLQFLNYKINNDLFNKFNDAQENNEEYPQLNEKLNKELNKELNDKKLEYNDDKNKSYKRKTLTLATEYGISIDKLSKISLKINRISNLYELNENQWKKIYNFIQQKIYKYKSEESENNNLIDTYQNYEKFEKTDIKNSQDYSDKFQEDNEIILEDEWQEIL